MNNQSKMIVTVMCLLVTCLLIACMTTTRNPAHLRLETARAIGGLTSDQVTTSNLHIGMTTATWEAATPKGYYKCESDDMLKRPAICVKQ